jgi:hypothetical protein
LHVRTLLPLLLLLLLLAPLLLQPACTLLPQAAVHSCSVAAQPAKSTWLLQHRCCHNSSQ